MFPTIESAQHCSNLIELSVPTNEIWIENGGRDILSA